MPDPRPGFAEETRGPSPGVLVTGAAGFLGSHLCAALEAKGCRVFPVVRPRNGRSALERMERRMRWFGRGAFPGARMHVVSGDLSRTRFGMDAGQFERLAGAVEEIVHCASDTSFSETNRKRSEQANVGVLDHLLDFAYRGSCRVFHHLSTAYAAGSDGEKCPEEFVRPTAFTNVYEETKCRAEDRLRRGCRAGKLRLTVYRPSVVYGHSRNGSTFRFNAMYHPMRIVHFLKNLYADDILRNAGRRAEKLGIRMEEDGRLCFPLRIEVFPQAGLDLVPVDHFIEAFLAIREENRKDGVFHIVGPRKVPTADLIGFGSRFFGISGVRCVHRRDGPVNALERLFDRLTHAYRPYMNDVRTFADERVRDILRRRRIACPDFTYEIFAACMRYAVEARWGAGIFR